MKTRVLLLHFDSCLPDLCIYLFFFFPSLFPFLICSTDEKKESVGARRNEPIELNAFVEKDENETRRNATTLEEDTRTCTDPTGRNEQDDRKTDEEQIRRPTKQVECLRQDTLFLSIGLMWLCSCTQARCALRDIDDHRTPFDKRNVLLYVLVRRLLATRWIRGQKHSSRFFTV